LTFLLFQLAALVGLGVVVSNAILFEVEEEKLAHESIVFLFVAKIFVIDGLHSKFLMDVVAIEVQLVGHYVFSAGDPIPVDFPQPTALLHIRKGSQSS
jgi:hypothetical protein